MTVIGASSGLTVGRAYTFTAVSVDATDNESAASTGMTAVIPLHTPDALFATTVGTTYPVQANVVSGSGTSTDPYVIPLVAGVNSVTPIVIEFDHSGETIVMSTNEHFRIDNMPTGASYTSSIIEWTFKAGAGFFILLRKVDGETPSSTDTTGRVGRTIIRSSADCGSGSDESCAMNTETDDTTLMPTSARTFGLLGTALSATDNLTLTLTPTP